MERGQEEGSAKKRQALWQELTRTMEEENERIVPCKVPGELWRIIASHFKHADLFAFALTCRSFREKQKEMEIEFVTKSSRAVEDAARLGNVKTLAWLRREGARFESHGRTCSAAARGGHLNALRWLRAQTPPCPWSEETCSAAASVGSVKTLAFLRSQDPPCPWNEEYTCWFAASNGHLDALKFLRAQDPPCPGTRRCSPPQQAKAIWRF